MRSSRRLFVLGLVILTTQMGTSANQRPEVHRIMREKLVHSHRLLEALVTSNWTELSSQSGSLERLTHDSRWTVFNGPEFIRHSEAFRQAIRELKTAADDRNLDAAPQAYGHVTQRCVDCHRHLARSRLAR